MNELNLGTEKIKKLFYKYAIPSVISSIIFSIYIVIDGIFVGRVVGPQGLAMVNIAMPIFSMALALGIMISVGGNTVVSIELGEGRKEDARESFSLGFFSLIVISSVIGIIIFLFRYRVATALGATPSLMKGVIEYLVILCLCVPFFTGGSYLAAGIRTMGMPTFSMFCTVLGSVLNIILDYVFVVLWGWGVAGAALASGIAFFISFLLAFIKIQSKDSILKLKKCKINLRKIGRFFYNGSSEALTEVAVAFTTFIFNIVLMRKIGEMGVSAFSIIQYIASLVVAVYLGIANGITPIISYNYGAKKGERINELIKYASKVMVILGIICTGFLFFGGETLISFFVSNDKILLETTSLACKIYSLAFLVSGLNILASSYFTALEDAKTSAIISFLRGIALIFIGIIVLPAIMGDSGIWLTVAFSEFLTLLIALVLLKKSKSKLIQL